jgi:LemA protein
VDVALALGLVLIVVVSLVDQFRRRRRTIRRLLATTAQERSALELIRLRRHAQTQRLLVHLQPNTTEGTEASKRALAGATSTGNWDDEAELSRALYLLFAEGERHPQLWADAAGQASATDLGATQQRLALVTRASNENLRRLNSQVTSWPSCLVARALRVERLAYFHDGLELTVGEVCPVPVRARRSLPGSTSLAS